VRLHALLLLCALLPGCPRREPPSTLDSASRPAPGPPLHVEEVSFAGPAGHRPDGKFSRGETVTCLFTVAGFTYKEGRADIVADVKVRGPEGELELHQPDLVLLRGAAPTQKPGSIRSAATLTLTPAATPGKHRVELTVRDVLGHRAGTGSESFTLLGKPPAKSANLTLAGLHEAADTRLPPGSALPVAFEVRGFVTAKGKREGHRRIDLEITTGVEDQAGQRLSSRTETLLKTELLFSPPAYPLEHVTLLPGNLAPGSYRLALAVRDRIGKGTTEGLFRFQVVPSTFGIVNLHLHDAAGLPRRTFLLGEQAYIRLSVHGLKVNARGEVGVAVDLAVAGPDGGVYLARKEAAALAGEGSKAAAAAGRYPVELPLVLPTICPAGKYRLVMRARDRLARRETVRELPFRIEGSAPKPMGSFKIERLEVQDRPDLPPSKGDTFVAGRTYRLTLRLGGPKLQEPRRMTFLARIKGDLRLKDMTGRVVHEKKGLFEFERTLTYRPLRILMPAKWEAPQLRSGLYDLEVVALDELDDRVSQMVRRVEVVGRRAVP